MSGKTIKVSEKKLGMMLENIIKENYDPATAVNKVLMFGFNYPPQFITSVWADEPSLAQHLQGKFSGYYNRFSANGVFANFYINLDSENQRKLVDWILANYNG